MPRDERLERVAAKDWTAVADFTRSSFAVAPELAALAKHPDAEVRELALFCLDSVGGREAQVCFVDALRDPIEDVQNRAALFLRAVGESDLRFRLVEELRSNPSDYVRERVALAIGKLGRQDVLPDLREHLTSEAVSPVREAIGLALARLEDPEQQEKVFSRLRKDDVESRLIALEQFEYLGKPARSHVLAPLLDDRRDALNVAPGGYQQFIRVCDVAVNVLGALLGERLGVPVRQAVRYADAELERARRASLERS